MTIQSWLSSSFVRHFPHSPAQLPTPLTCEAALNERFSVQVALRMEEGESQQVRVEAAGPNGWTVRVRQVGFVPVRHLNTPVLADPVDVEGLGHIPGFVPDPLLDTDTLLLPMGETHAFWIAVQPGPNAVPGEHMVHIDVVPARDERVRHTLRVRLYPVELQPRRDFSITHWFYNDALIDWYHTDLFDERYWAILPAYVRNMVDHGQDTLYVPLFTPPLDGVKRPSQLLRVTRSGPDHYTFDWQDVVRYLAAAREAGVQHFEWCHFFTQWGVERAIRIYEGQGRDEALLWPPETGATSETYRNFLAQLLPALHRFLEVEGLLGCSYFHVSDEPHGAAHLENYRRARSLLAELAPWMRVMDALSEIAFGEQGLTDMPIPSISTALDFVKEGLPCWCYYCCGPRGSYLNRLCDTPLAKIAMHGLLFYRWPFRGFLHWGYNYWYRFQTRELIDPYQILDAYAWERGLAYGDPFEVYPGPEGPVDSMRWEIFGESLQDYRLLQTLGVDRDDPRMAPLHSFADFPKTAEWRRALRHELLSGA